MSIHDFSLADGTIQDIRLQGDDVKVTCQLWDHRNICLLFAGTAAMKAFSPLGRETGQLLCRDHSPLLDELHREILSSGGSTEELARLRSYAFLSPWDDQVLLELLATGVETFLP